MMGRRSPAAPDFRETLRRPGDALPDASIGRCRSSGTTQTSRTAPGYGRLRDPRRDRADRLRGDAARTGLPRRRRAPGRPRRAGPASRRGLCGAAGDARRTTWRMPGTSGSNGFASFARAWARSCASRWTFPGPRCEGRARRRPRDTGPHGQRLGPTGGSPPAARRRDHPGGPPARVPPACGHVRRDARRAGATRGQHRSVDRRAVPRRRPLPRWAAATRSRRSIGSEPG